MRRGDSLKNPEMPGAGRSRSGPRRRRGRGGQVLYTTPHTKALIQDRAPRKNDIVTYFNKDKGQWKLKSRV